MSTTVYLNGSYLPRAQAMLPVDERGFIFGDGIYEVTRAIEGRLFEPERHLARLDYGLRGIGITPPLSGEAILDIHHRLLSENELTDGEATVYLQITRGAAPRAHQFPPPGTPPTVFLSATRYMPNAELKARGGAAVTYPDIRWSRCDLKTVNLLASVLAKQNAVASGVLESIFIRDGAITEGSHTNVFGVIGGELRTYPRSNYILGGVTRDVIFELAADLGIPARETPIYQQQIPQLEELMITGTTTDVTPVVQLDGKPVGTGKPGPIARALYEALSARMRAADVAAAGSR
jgi:D-alanine transaminase